MRIALPLVLLIGACSAEKDAASSFDPDAKANAHAVKDRADAAATRAGFAPDQPKPLQTVSVDPIKVPAAGVVLPPATMQYRYIGRWAATTALCEGGAWKFETRNLHTAGDTNCNFPTVGTIPSGFELQGECRTAGKKTPQTVKLTFDEVARRMHVVGATIGPATLLYCGN